MDLFGRFALYPSSAESKGTLMNEILIEGTEQMKSIEGHSFTYSARSPNAHFIDPP